MHDSVRHPTRQRMSCQPEVFVVRPLLLWAEYRGRKQLSYNDFGIIATESYPNVHECRQCVDQPCPHPNE